MGKTIVEKIFSSHSNKDAKRGEIVLAKVDFLMAQDGTAPLVIKSFENLRINKIFDSNSVVFVIDHNSPSPNEGVSSLHKLMRD
ncbi:MAG: 3-isopropylmalate dehydratase large subunit, partial [bacterium]|nr:3-isopropylmalate dehydratase large subunit [bacterium]MDW8163699.1 3-isopropylmalate dehydratase large subunit [Candidatus Omnitrophota bacterium]